MAKYENISKLSKQEQEDLFIKLARSLASLKNPVEAANLMRDLLSEQEALLLARRLRIAELLNEGLTYKQIHRLIKVGDNTIAKIQLWINNYGEGFRTVINRSKKSNLKSDNASSWRQMKKRYPIYFWPELLLEEIITRAGKRERERLKNVLAQVKEKNRLTQQLTELLKT